jgi:hypothetical protein
MRSPAHLLTATTIAALALALVGCSKRTPPEPSASPAPLPAAASVTAVEQSVVPARPTISLEALQSACDTHLTKYAGVNKTTGTTCTATERVLFQKDPSGACLNCLFQGGCLDIPGNPNRECGDTGPGGIKQGTEAQCVDTLRCLVGASADGSSGPSPAHGLAIDAYCGKQPLMPNCTGTPGPAGACVEVEKAGFPATSTPGSIVQTFGNRAMASGMANSILVCAFANSCKTCME